MCRIRISNRTGWSLVSVGVVIGLLTGVWLALVQERIYNYESDVDKKFQDIVSEIERSRSSAGTEHVITDHEAEGSNPSGISTPLPTLEIINVKVHTK